MKESIEKSRIGVIKETLNNHILNLYKNYKNMMVAITNSFINATNTGSRNNEQNMEYFIPCKGKRINNLVNGSKKNRCLRYTKINFKYYKYL